MAQPTATNTGLLTVRKTIINLVGFAVGIALFVWIVRRALEEGQWDRLTSASPWMVMGLLGCTVVSAVVNGTTFWVTIRPVKRLGWFDLQVVNLAANMLNYAPVRLGAIGRVLYHLKVDRLNLLQISAWFALIGYVLMLGVGSCLVATLVRTEFDLIWVAMVLGQMVLGGAIARVFAGHRLVARYARGVERIAADPSSLWGAVALRLVDLGAYTGRMAAALLILDMHIEATSIVVLAVVALAASLIPFGRLGFREACVALTADRLNMMGDDVEATFAQLALVESMGEAIIFIPLGAVALYFVRKRWGESGERDEGTEGLRD